ncbi:MAG: hypothetical protein AB7V46_00115 [Thermomicrobiales bacterium]
MSPASRPLWPTISWSAQRQVYPGKLLPAVATPFMMTPIERRTALVRLLADIDQRIELARALRTSPLLTRDERRFAEVELHFQQQSVERVEQMLARLA